MDGFEWDPAKEEKNIRERGIDFTMASQIWGRPVLEKIDNRRDYGETRISASVKLMAAYNGRRIHMAWNQSPHHLGSKGKSA